MTLLKPVPEHWKVVIRVVLPKEPTAHTPVDKKFRALVMVLCDFGFLSWDAPINELDRLLRETGAWDGL